MNGTEEVMFAPFFISASEVTWGTWQAVGAEADDLGYDINQRGAGFSDDGPVHTVTWYDVIKWCNLRSEIEGRTPVYEVGDQIYRTGQDNDGESFFATWLLCVIFWGVITLIMLTTWWFIMSKPRTAISAR